MRSPALFLALPCLSPASLLLIKHADFDIFEAHVTGRRRKSDFVDLINWFHRSASPQGIYYPPGVLGTANRIRHALMECNTPYPDAALAKAIYRATDAQSTYSYSSSKGIWRMEVHAPPSFREPITATDWYLCVENGFIAALAGDELVEATQLFPLLNGTLNDIEVRTAIRGNAPQEALLEQLLSSGVVQNVKRHSINLDNLPDLVFLGHSSFFIRGARGSVIVDPAFCQTERGVFDPRAFSLLERADAVLLTHHHWDHCNPATLLRIPRNKPIYVPRCHRASYANPPLAKYLATWGFKNIRVVTAWEHARIGDVNVTFTPSHGEPFGLDSRFDSFGVLISFSGRTLYSSGDACHDEAGTMDSVILRLAHSQRPIDFFACGSSGAHWWPPVTAGWYRKFSNELLKQPDLIRYHPTTEDALRWTAMLRPKALLPIAHFLWIPRHRPVLHFREGLRKESYRRLFDRYRVDLEDACPHDTQVRSWLAGLAAIGDRSTTPILGLHPLQGILTH